MSHEWRPPGIWNPPERWVQWGWGYWFSWWWALRLRISAREDDVVVWDACHHRPGRTGVYDTWELCYPMMTCSLFYCIKNSHSYQLNFPGYAHIVSPEKYIFLMWKCQPSVKFLYVHSVGLFGWGSFCMNYRNNAAWHGDDQPVTLLRGYGAQRAYSLSACWVSCLSSSSFPGRRLPWLWTW